MTRFVVNGQKNTLKKPHQYTSMVLEVEISELDRLAGVNQFWSAQTTKLKRN